MKRSQHCRAKRGQMPSGACNLGMAVPAEFVKNTADMALVALVVESGSISAASRMTGMDRSALGRRLAALEDRIGVSLFDRDSQKIRLTSKGLAFFPYCHHVREIALRAEALIQGRVAPGAGSIRLLAEFCNADRLLAPLLEAITADSNAPTMTVTVTMRREDEHCEADLILDVSAAAPDNEHAVCAVDCSVWANPRYLKEEEFSGNPADIARLSCITVADPSDGQQEWILKRDTSSVRILVRSSFRLGSESARLDACANGVGVAILPDFQCVDAERNGKLVRVVPTWRPPQQTLVARSHRDQPLSPDAALFIDYCQRDRAADIAGMAAAAGASVSA